MQRLSKLIGSIVVIFLCGGFAARSGAAVQLRAHRHEIPSSREGERSTNPHSERGGGSDVAIEAIRRPSSAPTNGRGKVGRRTAGDPGRTTAGVGGNSTAGHGINLVTPDDGYSGTSRRGASLMINGQKRDLRRTIPSGVIARPRPSPVGPTELSTNAIGVTIPNAGKNALSVGTHPVSGSVTTGLSTNSVGVSILGRMALHAAPSRTAGINGTATRRVVVGAGTVGGSAKNQSVNGSVLRRKF
jgi:hypothetical protein